MIIADLNIYDALLEYIFSFTHQNDPVREGLFIIIVLREEAQ